MFADVSWERGWFYRSPDGDMSLIGLEGWWMAPSQMGMWQGSLEVFCGAVLNKKSSLPTKKKRGLDLRSPNTLASPSSFMAFNTFLYTPELHINTHPYTNHFSWHFFFFLTPILHPFDTCCHIGSVSHHICPLNHLFDKSSQNRCITFPDTYEHA